LAGCVLDACTALQTALEAIAILRALPHTRIALSVPRVPGIAVAGEVIRIDSGTRTGFRVLDSVTGIGGTWILAGVPFSLPEIAFFAIAGVIPGPLGSARTLDCILQHLAWVRVTRVLDTGLRTLIPNEPGYALTGEVIGIDPLARTVHGIPDAVTWVRHTRILAGVPLSLPEIPFFAIAGVIVDIDALA
jgi:hypothetical protein